VVSMPFDGLRAVTLQLIQVHPERS